MGGLSGLLHLKIGCVIMNQLRARLQDASKARLPMILTVYILCQPLLDVLTGLGAEWNHPITAGVIVRSVVIVLVFLYAVFLSDFPGKRRAMIFTGALVGYLILFMAHMFMVGSFSLCVSNVREVVKTFFAPFMLVFLWSVYRQYGYLVSAESIAWAGALYVSVIPISEFTESGYYSYGSSGYGQRGWFYAANEVGCVIALAAPFTIWYCLKIIPTVTKKTWWKGALACWALFAVAYSANFLGTKIIFAAITLYCAAVFIWQLVQLRKERTRTRKIQTVTMGAMLFLTLGIFLLNSPLLRYLVQVYLPLLHNEPEITIASWGEEIQAAAKGTWLMNLLNSNELLESIDQILSRRMLSSAPAVQVYTEEGIAAKLLGIGYANAAAYSRPMYFMVEMDPLSMLIRHGIVGFLLYYVPYLGFLGWAIGQFFKRIGQRMSSLRYCTALYCTLVGFGISTIAGHALVAPAVATFLLVVAFQLLDQTCEQNRLFQGK